ncbi:MAG: sugar ABC transporter ATP-binding protein, partial [Candidatus Dormibacteraeota bacterium]|nr:sugar ABC transporter ATP-binding protein [Candidatus Dormibacteraeota bacterium]
VSLELMPGEVHAVCGENGAGKSTLMRLLVGVDQPDAGELVWEGTPTTIDSPAHASALGISMVHQELHLTPQLSVGENVYAGALPRRAGVLVSWRQMHRDTDAALKRLGAPFRSRDEVATLKIAHRQLVEIAKALVRASRVLILDEPTASLTRVETDALLDVVRSLRREGLATLYVSHRLEEVLAVADRVSILRDGKLVGTRHRSEVTQDDLIRLMVGRQVTLGAAPPPVLDDRLRLEVRSLTSQGVFRDVSFTARSGEIVGLYGLIGSGRTELARAVFGLDTFEGGEVLVDGRALPSRRPWRSRQAGLVYTSEDRKAVGLILPMSIRDNIAVPNLHRLSRHGLMRPAAERALAESLVAQLHIRPPDPERPVRQLSGGNQQKIALGKWLATDPSVLLLDEPTRGIDIGAKEEVYELIRSLARQGRSIVFISSELPEMLNLPHRVLVMREGRLVGQLNRGQATEEALMALAARPTVATGRGLSSA